MIASSIYAQETKEEIDAISTKSDITILNLILEGIDTDNYSKRLETIANEEGKTQAVALNILAECYFHGRGVERNHSKALDLYTKSANLGYKISYIALGHFYEKGIVVDKDEKKSITLYRQAAFAGWRDAYVHLGKCYLFGIGTEQNIETAINWLEKAANLGHDIATIWLGDIYYYYLEKYEIACEWYKKADDMKMAGGALGLGHCYRNGHGITKNEEKALEYYKKAYQAGLEEAKQYIDDILK